MVNKINDDLCEFVSELVTEVEKKNRVEAIQIWFDHERNSFTVTFKRI